MELIYCKSKWEMWHDPLRVFVERAAVDGFDATELYLDSVKESPEEIRSVHLDHGLELLGQILTKGDSPREHLESLDRQFDIAIACGSFAVNCHAGRDIFDFDSNVRILARIIELGANARVPVMVETHRGRPTYSSVDTARYLKAIPELRLTADFSHWMVVHESDLSDQPDNVAAAIRRSDHIHARVGYEEGPQITDPLAPEWDRHVATHFSLWQRIVEARAEAGAGRLTITPEFGPPMYMHTLPHTNAPVADTWQTNVVMKRLLEERLRVL